MQPIYAPSARNITHSSCVTMIVCVLGVLIKTEPSMLSMWFEELAEISCKRAKSIVLQSDWSTAGTLNPIQYL